MERLKEIITKNYTSDFPEGVEIENQKEYIKTVREEEQENMTVIAIMLLMTKLTT